VGAASLRSLIAEQLALSARIVAGGNDVAPRFVLDSPTGRLTLFCQWPQDEDAQRIAFAWIADLFRWRQVTAAH